MEVGGGIGGGLNILHFTLPLTATLGICQTWRHPLHLNYKILHTRIYKAALNEPESETIPFY